MQDYSGICVISTKLLPKLAIYLDAFFKLRLWLLSVNTVKHYGITDDGPTYNVCQISACILKVRLSILQSHQIVVAIYEPLSCYETSYKRLFGAVVVAQLSERSLLKPKVRDSNPVIAKMLSAALNRRQ